MSNVAYTNKFDKPVYKVNNLAIRKNAQGYYELQLNDQYFQLTEQQVEAIDSITRLPDNIGLSMG